jgi:hypothetical protein
VSRVSLVFDSIKKQTEHLGYSKRNCSNGIRTSLVVICGFGSRLAPSLQTVDGVPTDKLEKTSSSSSKLAVEGVLYLEVDSAVGQHGIGDIGTDNCDEKNIHTSRDCPSCS